jgi:hypothetical protein
MVVALSCACAASLARAEGTGQIPGPPGAVIVGRVASVVTPVHDVWGNGVGSEIVIEVTDRIAGSAPDTVVVLSKQALSATDSFVTYREAAISNPVMKFQMPLARPGDWLLVGLHSATWYGRSQVTGSPLWRSWSRSFVLPWSESSDSSGGLGLLEGLAVPGHTPLPRQGRTVAEFLESVDLHCSVVPGSFAQLRSALVEAYRDRERYWAALPDYEKSRWISEPARGGLGDVR